MARTTIPVQSVGVNGGTLNNISWTAADATNDMEFANSGREILLVKNADASTHTCTVASVADQYGRTGDLTISATAGSISVRGPLLPTLFSQTDGKVYVNFGTGEDTSVTVAVIRFSL